MFSFSPSQGLVEHILVISHGIMVGNYVKRKKKWCLMKKMGKVAKGEKEKKKEKKKSIPLCSEDFMLKELEIKRN